MYFKKWEYSRSQIDFQSCFFKFFQQFDCNKYKEEFCKLFYLTDCNIQVKLTDEMKFGQLQHNLTICDEFQDNFADIKKMQESNNQDEIYEEFYKIYLNLTMVILKDIFVKYLFHYTFLFFKKLTGRFERYIPSAKAYDQWVQLWEWLVL